MMRRLAICNMAGPVASRVVAAALPDVHLAVALTAAVLIVVRL